MAESICCLVPQAAYASALSEALAAAAGTGPAPRAAARAAVRRLSGNSTSGSTSGEVLMYIQVRACLIGHVSGAARSKSAGITPGRARQSQMVSARSRVCSYTSAYN